MHGGYQLKIVQFKRNNMTDYKTTLNLPKTAFPMKANLAQREPEQLKRWAASDLNQSRQHAREGEKAYILHDGPPYANGQIHIGHAVNKTLKDIVVKSQFLNGFNTPYVPGWDCHGLPIELNVEKKVGKVGVKVSVEDFCGACRKYANSQVDIQRESFQRLGVLGSWDKPYLTMDFGYEAGTMRTLARVFENGHIKRHVKPVYWCTDCGSALAEAEVEYKDKHSPSIDVRFSVVDVDDLLSRCHGVHAYVSTYDGDVSVVIWTTTPWTLPANEAVSVNPNLDYAVVEVVYDDRKEWLVIAEALIADAMHRYNIDDYRVVAYCVGRELDDLVLKHPLYDKNVPVVLGEHVTTEAGTGCVHTAPGHGPDDYVVGMRNELPINNPVNAKGCFKEDVPLFAGLHITKANGEIMSALKEADVLLREAAVDHSYPHCWRHKIPLIYRATPQWFVDLDQNGLRKMALSEIKKTEWVPAWGQERIKGMIDNHPGWCISRQRAWGTPIPVFLHKETDEPHPDTVKLIHQVAERVELEGLEAWYRLDVNEFLGEDADDYVKGQDVLDVWFDAGSSQINVLEARDNLSNPADIYLEGSDQHRGWFQTSLLIGCAVNGHAPFKTVLTHGFAVDADGRKMSKSVGNVVAPDKVIKTLGADVLRLWIASTDYKAEMTVSDEIMKRVSDAYRRLRNTMRFMLANLHDFDPAAHTVAPKELVALDAWLIQRAKALQAEVIEAYNQFEFHAIYQKLTHFCSVELGSFYLDVIKDRQYTCATDSVARRSAQTAMFYVAEAMVRWFAPILSFTAEEVWQVLPGERGESVFLEKWYDAFPNLSTRDDQIDWTYFMALRDEVNKAIEVLRTDGKLGSSLEANVTLYADDELYDTFNALGEELRFILITSGACVKKLSDAPDDAMSALDLKMTVTASEAQKCERCWHRRNDVGKDPAHPDICTRCINNISGPGETRRFA
jgi:isoleucyl-tRNA synthetase